MKENREAITRYLNKYLSAKTAKLLYEFIQELIIRNPDFSHANPKKSDDVRVLLRETTGRDPALSFDEVISPEDMEVVHEFIELYGASRIKKARRIELISRVASSDALFEGICLVMADAVKSMPALSLVLGCPQRWKELSHDDIFMKRLEYKNSLCKYLQAAANLYGCLHVLDMYELLEK